MSANDKARRKDRQLQRMRAQAKECASRGWHVVRLYPASSTGCGCGSAAECARVGRHIRGKLAEATTDPKRLDEYWADTAFNVGVVLGGPSRLCAIQFDEKMSSREPLPSTPHFRYGKTHTYLFEVPPGLPMIEGAIEVREGVRLLGSGRYVAVPPSRVRAGEVEWIGGKDGPAHQLPKTLWPPVQENHTVLRPAPYLGLVSTPAPSRAPVVADGSHLSAASLSLLGAAERVVAAGLSTQAAAAALRCEAASLAIHVSDDELGDTLDFAEHVAGPWSSLRSLDRAALVGVAGDVVASIAETTGAAAPAVLGTFLTLFAHSICAGVRFTFGREVHSPALYTAICGEPGYLGSDVPQAALNDLFESAVPSWSHRQAPIRGLVTPRLKALLMPPDDDEPTFNSSTRSAFVLETSLERAFHVLSSRGSLPVVENLRDAWSHSPQRGSSNGFPLTVLGGLRLNSDLQRTGWAERLPELGARFCWFVANSSSVPTDEPNSHERLQALAQRLKQRIAESVGVSVTFSANAESLSRRLGQPVLLGDRVVDTYLARAPHILRRLSVVYACLAGRSEVTEDDVASAGAVWAYNAQSVRYIFGDRELQRAVYKLETAFVRQVTLSRTQVNEVLSNNVSAAFAARALSVLERRGVIAQVPSQSGPKGGRTPEVWRWCST